MGVYIPKMEIPECCGYCPFEYQKYCMAKPSLAVESADRHPRCPLVPVPAHGDLVDRREAIIDANERAYDFWLSDDEVNSTIQFLNEQDAIIPAEEETT